MNAHPIRDSQPRYPGKFRRIVGDEYGIGGERMGGDQQVHLHAPLCRTNLAGCWRKTLARTLSVLTQRGGETLSQTAQGPLRRQHTPILRLLEQ